MSEHNQIDGSKSSNSTALPISLSMHFWDKIALKYSRKRIDDLESYEYKLNETQTFLRPESLVLEFGCGTGSTALHHASKVKHILAIDYSRKMIDIAQSKSKEMDTTNVTFEVSAIENIRMENGSFDVILGMSILHLLRDPEEAIARVNKLLKPGGVFISSTHCIGDKTPWVRHLVPIGRFLRIMPFVKVFTKLDLIGYFLNTEFKVEHEWEASQDKAMFFVVSKSKIDQLVSVHGQKRGGRNA